MKKIILISGKAEHGKDTLAEYLKERLEEKGQTVVIDRFAKYIKGYLKDYYNWDGKEKNEFVRSKLQVLGTEMIKEKLNFKSFHAKRLCEDFQIVQDDFDYFIVPDTRFRDEVHMFKALFPDDVVTTRVIRLGHESKLTEEQLNHKSETDLDKHKFDSVIFHQSLDSLYDECNRVFKSIL